MKNRLIATIAGGLISVAAYALIPSMAGRTAIMMLSGYVSFYFTSYRQTFACSTIGALGGAVFTSAFTIQAIGSIFLIRVGYVLAGALIAYIANCLIFPYNREKATVDLWKKYKAVADYLKEKGHDKKVDDQLYYNLVIRSYLMEEKLSQNKQSIEA